MKNRLVVLAFATCIAATNAAFAQNTPLLEASRSGIGMGRVVVGYASTPPVVVIMKLDRAGTASVGYQGSNFDGNNFDEFSFFPVGTPARPVTQAGTVISFTCQPRELGRRKTTFAPTTVGAANDPNSFPLKLSCIGVGKTRNSTELPIWISNGDMSAEGALSFPDHRVGESSDRIVSVVNKSKEAYTIRARWVYGPRNRKTGMIGGQGISMIANPAPMATGGFLLKPNAPPLQIKIRFKPPNIDGYQATLEVRYDRGATVNRPGAAYTYIVGKGIE
jgi:hypothetical protein